MKYRVLRNCYGFMGRGWFKGEIVDLDPKSNPGEHFLALEVVEPPKPVEEQEVTAVVEEQSPAEPMVEQPKSSTVKKAVPKSKKRLK